jgi:EmrB/QacA subfamily drug resistance transporter
LTTPGPGHVRHPGLGLAVLLAATLAFALEQTAMAPALSAMRVSLHTSPHAVVWVLTSVGVADAVLTPVLGRLGDLMGRRRVLIWSLLVLAVGGAVSTFADNLPVMLAGRVLQGAGSAVFPLGFGIARDLYPPRRRTVAVGLLASLTGLSAGLGPVLGGLFVDHFSYRWIFGFSVVTALGSAVAVRAVLPAGARRAAGRLDLPGAAVLAAGLVALLVGVSHTQDWRGRAYALIAAGLIVLAGFLLLERRRRAPLVDVGLLARRDVLLANLAALLIGFGMLDALSIIPRLAETPKAAGYGFGTGATEAGALLLPGCVLMTLAGPLAGRMAARFGAGRPFAFGAALATAGLVLLAAAHSSPAAVAADACVLLVGVGFAFSAMPILIMEAVPAESTGEATGVNTLMRAVGTAVGTDVAGTLLANSVARHSSVPAAYSYPQAFLTGAVVVLAAVAVTLPLALRRRTPSPAPAGSVRVAAAGEVETVSELQLEGEAR